MDGGALGARGGGALIDLTGLAAIASLAAGLLAAPLILGAYHALQDAEPATVRACVWALTGLLGLAVGAGLAALLATLV